MATKNFNLKDEAVKLPFAAVGALDLVVERVRTVSTDVQTRVNDTDLKPEAIVNSSVAAYGDLATRGEKLVDRIRKGEETKAAVSQAKSTKSQAKGAVTATRNKAESSASSTKGAAKRTGDDVEAGAKTTAKTARTGAKKTTATAKSGAKGTTTAAKKTAEKTSTAVSAAAKKVGD